MFLLGAEVITAVLSVWAFARNPIAEAHNVIKIFFTTVETIIVVKLQNENYYRPAVY